MSILIFSTMLATSLAQPSTRFSQLNTRVPNPCSTHTGDQCVFPFSYQGVEYYRCTYADSPTPWCATQVDSAGVVVTNKWGDCDWLLVILSTRDHLSSFLHHPVRSLS